MEELSLILDSEDRPRYIRPDHECFTLDSVVAFREEHNIDVNSNRWDNFKQLLCGCQDLPFIILQNPAKSHVKDYREMKKCRTMKWLSTTLEDIGLTLEEVVVLDVCSLLSDDDLNEMDRRSQDKWAAVEESYKMTEDILRLLKPDVVIACQCSTRGKWDKDVVKWACARNTLARDLCSKETYAKDGLTQKIFVGSHAMSMVYGVHPSRAHWSRAMRPVLKRVFETAFLPCMERFEIYGRQPVLSTVIEVAPLNLQETDELDEQFSKLNIMH